MHDDSLLQKKRPNHKKFKTEVIRCIGIEQKIILIKRWIVFYGSCLSTSLPNKKQQLYIPVSTLFMQLDLASHYFLFSLIEERLPRRAKLLFVAEDYQGKKDTILEVMQHWLEQGDQEKVA